MVVWRNKLRRRLYRDKSNYLARVGCWNCDAIYELSIKKGKNLPEYLIEEEPPCKRCGCDSLKPFMEWTTEKDIMKDLVLHHRIEQLSKDDENDGMKYAHYK